MQIPFRKNEAISKLAFLFCLCVVTFWPAVVCGQEPKAASEVLVDESSKPKRGAPLIFDGHELFRIYTRLGPYTPERRVEAITDRLQAIVNSGNFKSESLSTSGNDYGIDIVNDGDAVMTITNDEAKEAGPESRSVLAGKYCEIIRTALKDQMAKRSPRRLILGLAYSAAATACLLIFFSFMGWIFHLTFRAVSQWQLRSVTIQKAELISKDTIKDVITGFLSLVRAILVFVALGAYATMVLSFFPTTRDYSGLIIASLIEPVIKVFIPSVISYVPNIFLIIVIAVVTHYFISFIHFLFREIERGSINLDGFDSEWASPTYKIVRFLMIAFSLVLIFPYLPGSGSPAFQQVSIFLGILISLGSSGAISNIVAGVFLTYTGAFRLGDRVRIADTTGDVVQKTLLATRVKTIKNEYITIPNSLVLSSHIINYSYSAKEAGLILHTVVTISYDAPWQTVHRLLLEAAGDTEHLLRQPEPFVYQKSLDDYYVSYELNAHTDRPHIMVETYSKMHENIQTRFHQAGIEIMSPAYSSLRDGNQITIPAAERPPDYQPRSFKVKVQTSKPD